MAISTYAELLTAAANWTGRLDLTSRIPEFITLAEAKLNRDLRCRQMEQRSYATATEYMALPTDYLELRNVQLNTTPKTPLKTVPPEYGDTYYSNASGKPIYFAILANQIQLMPAPDATYEIEIDYYQKIPALTGSNTTNWLLSYAPDMYLYAALLEASVYLTDDPRIPGWRDGFQSVFNSLNSSDRKQRWSGAPMVVRPS